MNERWGDAESNGWRCGECGGSRARPAEDELVGVGAVRMDGDGRGSEVSIAPEDILFAFTQGAVRAPSEGGRNQAILAKWTAKHSFSPATVFLRTRSGIYRSYLRTLQEFKSKVPAAQFGVVSQSVIANLRNVDFISLGRQRVRTLSYAVEESEFSWPFDFVVVGRDHLKRIRARFGMPARPRANPYPPVHRHPARVDYWQLSTGSCANARSDGRPAVESHDEARRAELRGRRQRVGSERRPPAAAGGKREE